MRAVAVKAMVGVTLIISMMVAGCGSGASPSGNKGAIRVAIILGGVANDGGFNEAGATAARSLRERRLVDTVQIRESVSTAHDAEPIVRQYAADGYDLVIGWSSVFADSLYRISAEFPDSHFLTTGDATDKQKSAANVENWNWDSEQFGYLLGWVAGHTHLSPIGIVDGQQIPPQERQWHGFELGVHAVNPGATVRTPIYLGSWEDAQAAHRATIAQLDSGARLIATNAEGYSPGVAAAAASRDTATLGMSSTTSDAATTVNIGRARLDMTPILPTIVERLKNGSFGKKTSVSTIQNRSLILDTVHKVQAAPAVPDDLQSRAGDLARQLAEGKVRIGS
ncbi:hypothetical protein HUW46_09338 [Amycolatopsis sp. CA-230715]|nr:hypothetical protein HUW46_09338 [Amycolatopsis sp. CA-230715]